MNVRALAGQLSEWVASLDSRPREKRLAVGSGVVAALVAWFGVALGSPLLLLAVPAMGAVLFTAVRTQRRLLPTDGPIELSLEGLLAPAVPAVAATPATTPEREEPADEPAGGPEDNLLSRISLAPPPPPVGRSSASYVYEPDPERDVPTRDAHAAALDADDFGERVYEVWQVVDGRSVVRHSGPSLFGATDFALGLRGPSQGGDVIVVRARGETRESVLRFSADHPPEGSDSAKSMLDLFGYPVTRWRGPAA